MIIDLLKTALADHIEAALIVHGYHWSVEGPDFNQYHNFFGEIYDDYQDQVDTIAEYVRIISSGTEYIFASASIVKLNTTIKAVPLVGNKVIRMCREIQIINESLQGSMEKLFKVASEQNFEGLANYCADRENVHSKLNWKLAVIAK